MKQLSLLEFLMEKAIVLISLQATMEQEALESIKSIQGVQEAHFLYGPYDAYALIEAESSHQIQNIIIDHIRVVKGIRTTVTCFVAD
jgi:DNA-binding Lrp family transcriptional regulator